METASKTLPSTLMSAMLILAAVSGALAQTNPIYPEPNLLPKRHDALRAHLPQRQQPRWRQPE